MGCPIRPYSVGWKAQDAIEWFHGIDRLDIVRPRMLKRRTYTAFWLNRFGDALSYVAIGLIFSRHSINLINRLGFHIAPHDARDAAATTWALSAPDRIGIAREILGHSDLHTTIRHYNRARGIEARRAYGRVLSGVRRRQRRRPRWTQWDVGRAPTAACFLGKTG
jgi:integrase